jgi:ribonuclease-3
MKPSHRPAPSKLSRGQPRRADSRPRSASPETRVRYPTAEQLAALQKRIGYTFADPQLLLLALHHPSMAVFDRHKTNQRLEFLGDSILAAVLTEAVYRAGPLLSEGELDRNRIALTRGTSLAALARQLGLPECLILAPGEDQAGGRDREAAQEDAFEALVGAVFLDGGHEAARGALLRWYGPIEDRVARGNARDNPKGRLQEMVQMFHPTSALRYELVATTGADHARRFEIALYFKDELIGRGFGTSKKQAEEQAALEALKSWKPPPPTC